MFPLSGERLKCALCACSHAIVSSLVGPEYYVNIMSFVDKTQLEPGCSILLHNKVSCPATCDGIAFYRSAHSQSETGRMACACGTGVSKRVCSRCGQLYTPAYRASLNVGSSGQSVTLLVCD